MSHPYKYPNNRGHVWQRSGSSIDIFAMSEGYHNGPKCVKCGYEFCHHCNTGPSCDCPNAKKKKKVNRRRSSTKGHHG